MEIVNYMVFDEEKDFGMDVDYLYNPKTEGLELVSVDYLTKEDL